MTSSTVRTTYVRTYVRPQLHVSQYINDHKQKLNNEELHFQPWLNLYISHYVLWSPFYVVKFLPHINTNVSLPCLFVWLASYIFPLLYPAINPIVYFVFNKKYRQLQGLKKIIYMLCFCNKESNRKLDPSISSGPAENCIESGGHVNQAVENFELHEQN